MCAYRLQPAPVLCAMCTDEAEREQHAGSHTHLPKQNKSPLAVSCTPVCTRRADEEREGERKGGELRKRKERQQRRGEKETEESAENGERMQRKWMERRAAESVNERRCAKERK